MVLSKMSVLPVRRAATKHHRRSCTPDASPYGFPSVPDEPEQLCVQASEILGAEPEEPVARASRVLCVSQGKSLVGKAYAGTVFSTDNSEAHASKGDKNESSGSANQAECQSLGLTGRLAVVTGGASGIGRSVCMVLAREGATVIVADRNRTGSDETIQMLQGSYPSDHRVIYVDVSNSTAVDVLFEEIATYFPSRKMSVVVNSAGIVEAAAPIQDMNDTQFDDTLATNLRAVALEVASSGIRVNAMLPGPVDTPCLQGYTGSELRLHSSNCLQAQGASRRNIRDDRVHVQSEEQLHDSAAVDVMEE
ncbi:hypothetical protein HPB47_019309 [Ixodes persulcatus]|uniref:Uncharacterized protein n=1 Tax=Ixodes persulcatus TaxID=34615 RepID=A0AC60QII8_IXOPE|nr:hypothetical protein HPB47_019309 [Ixodes persulcatus]